MEDPNILDFSHIEDAPVVAFPEIKPVGATLPRRSKASQVRIPSFPADLVKTRIVGGHLPSILMIDKPNDLGVMKKSPAYGQCNDGDSRNLVPELDGSVLPGLNVGKGRW